MRTNRTAIPLALTTALLLSLCSAGIARADCFTGQMSAGATVCREFLYLTTTACASGDGFGDIPHFVVFWTAGGTPYTKILHTTVTSFSQRWDSTNNPSLFPGFFQLCITNLRTDSGINFQICIGPC
jgi:hypothetical protein